MARRPMIKPWNLLLLLVLLGLGSSVLSVPAGAEEVANRLEVGFMNGVYEDLDANLQPIRQGAITIHVSSPEHRLTVHGNRLTLKTNSNGSLDAMMEVDFEGYGHLIADVESIGRFEDRVEARRQTAKAAGTVRLTRGEGRYLFTVVEADRSVRLRIQSGVARQVVGGCRLFSMLLSLPCDGLDQALTSVHVPMPEPGEQFEVRDDLLSEAERAYFDRFVSSGK